MHTEHKGSYVVILLKKRVLIFVNPLCFWSAELYSSVYKRAHIFSISFMPACDSLFILHIFFFDPS